MLRFVLPAIAQCSVFVHRSLDPRNGNISVEELIEGANQLMLETDRLEALTNEEIDALIPDDDPELLAEFAALQLEESGNPSFVPSWITASRDYLSPFARGAKVYFWAGVYRVGEYASSFRHPEPITTTTVAPVRRRPRRLVPTNQAPPRIRGKRMSRDEMIAASKQRDSAILSNLLRVYKTVKEKDPARASELACKILQIRKMKENRSH
jgi:hypothetical protein